jgi:hypothetical protein
MWAGWTMAASVAMLTWPNRIMAANATQVSVPERARRQLQSDRRPPIRQGRRGQATLLGRSQIIQLASQQQHEQFVRRQRGTLLLRHWQLV